MTPSPMLAARDRVDAAAAQLKDLCDVDGSPVAAAAWHMAEGLRVLASLGHAQAAEMVLQRALDALAEDGAP